MHGVEEFRMAPRAIPEAKWLLRQMKRANPEQIVAEVMALGTARQIETRMQEYLTQFHTSPQDS
jgi:phosphoenolpyruvate-protein kinase (PTS system EI component)